MDLSDVVNHRLTSLTELIYLVGRSLAVQSDTPPQPIIDNIISALQDAQQWLATQAPDGDLVPTNHTNDRMPLDGVVRTRQSSTLETIPPPNVIIPSFPFFPSDQNIVGAK